MSKALQGPLIRPIYKFQARIGDGFMAPLLLPGVVYRLPPHAAQYLMFWTNAGLCEELPEDYAGEINEEVAELFL